MSGAQRETIQAVFLIYMNFFYYSQVNFPIVGPIKDFLMHILKAFSRGVGIISEILFCLGDGGETTCVILYEATL